ncbi:hypothetical protein BDV59DRAFT_116956 [Aspergillus ambiguus]|uniref:E3 ubiquitin-protein ligase RAD18 n=1 Tax=Aspergillus ambiguus TaxID=176160 RepID=UPI003CCE51E8
MEPSFDLPDSTDWLDTPLSLLTPLESALRCQVCKDFFDNPVITSCSHTFCSLCIRRCLSSEGKCPACRSSDQELKLRRNWAVQELVDAFQNARPSVLGLAKQATAEKRSGEGPVSKKRKVGDGLGESTDELEGRRTRSQSRGITRTQSETTGVEIVEDSQDEEYLPDDGLVSCPICNRRMRNEAVFQHLDHCNGVPPKPVNFGSLQPIQPQPAKPRDRLPAINYSILKDTVLRKKMTELGIPNWGPRILLQRRHTEWMNLWNANCDSKNPKSKRELLQELSIWERTQGGNAAPSAESSNGVMRKDFDASAWSASHDNDFKKLIANARKRSDALVRTTIPQTSAEASESQEAPQSSTPLEAVDEAQPNGVSTIDLTGVEPVQAGVATSRPPSQG